MAALEKRVRGRRGSDEHGRSEPPAALWISRGGQQFAYEALRWLFHAMGKVLIGQPLTAHSVRHALTTDLMERDRRNLQVTAAALGHCSTSSVSRSYNRSQGSGGQRVWRRILRQLARGNRSTLKY